MLFFPSLRKDPGAQATVLKARFESVAKKLRRRASRGRRSGSANRSSRAWSKEIENYEELQALYAAEHLETDPIREDAELLLPNQELDEVIRYETHLEDQIERKLRQFYARRREPLLRQAETLPQASEKTAAVSWPAQPQRWRRRGMAFAGNKGRMMILFAKTYRNFMATSCPSGANDPKAARLMKTKDQKRQFSFAKAATLLKQSQLQKRVGIRNLGDKLAGHAELWAGRITTRSPRESVRQPSSLSAS